MTLRFRYCIGMAVMLILSSHGSSCVAQPQPTFPGSHSQWTVNLDEMGNSVPDHILANTGVITLHGESAYGISRIENTGAPFTWDDMVLVGGIRDDAGRWKYQSIADSTEYLLYDFTGEVGDTVTVENPRWGLGPKSLVVLAIEPVQVEIGTRLQWELAPINGGIMEYWMEGIGSTLGFFGHAHPNDTAGTDEQLVCFHEDAILVYRILSTEQCSLISAIVEHKLLPTDLRIHPNPADQRVLLTLDPISADQPTRLRLWDMTGRSVLDQERIWSNGQTLLDTGDLPSGPYVVLVDTPRTLISRAILVIQH